MPFELGRLLLAQAQTSDEVIRLWGEAFPFSFVLDGSLTIISSGPLLRKIYPGVSIRSQLTHCFTSPQFTQTNVTALQLRAQAGQLLLLYCASRRALPPLRGQWLTLSGDHMLFLGWPWVTSFGQLAPLGISLVDIPPHNPLAEILLLLQTNRSAMDDARDLALTLKQSGEALEQVNLQLKQQVEERSRAEAAMAVARQLAEVTLESIGDGVIVIDLDSMVTSFNAAAARLTEIRPEHAMGQSLNALFAGRFDCDDLHACIMSRAVLCCAPSPVSAGNASLKLADGRVRELEYTISRIHDPRKKIVGSVLVLRDVSQAQALTRELAHQAYHDALTGLPNRLMLRDRLQQALQRAARRNEQLAVLFVDLDRFKAVNDTLGHRVGDALLCAVADRLRQTLRQSDTVAREGGDEFVIILEHIRNAHHGAAVARKLLNAMDAGYQIDGHTLYCTASIGVSFFPDDGANVEELIKHADAAMFESKDHGRNSVHFFSEEIYQRSTQRFELESQLRLALVEQQFVVYYQPQLTLPDQKIRGAEALVRWLHPQRGLVQPLSFIALAEEIGLTVPLGEWVLEQVCRQIAAWIAQYGFSPSVSVNVSARQLQMPEFSERIESVLRRYRIPPCLLELELTEHSLMQHHDQASVLLTGLKRQGVKLVLDDFGTGYSNLTTLSGLPFDRLKIDRSFVAGIIDNPQSRALVNMILALARELNLTVVAEGVESLDQQTLLVSLGCDCVQGYLHAPPLTSTEFAQRAFGNMRVPLASPA